MRRKMWRWTDFSVRLKVISSKDVTLLLYPFSGSVKFSSSVWCLNKHILFSKEESKDTCTDAAGVDRREATPTRGGGRSSDDLHSFPVF